MATDSSTGGNVVSCPSCLAAGDAPAAGSTNDAISGDKRLSMNKIHVRVAGQEESCPPCSDGFSNSSAELSIWRFWLLGLGVCLGLFLSLVDSSIVATSLYSIGSEFRSVDAVNWVALAYTLAYLGCAVTFASLSDVLGMRNAFLLAYVFFFAFSLACGFAKDLPQLICFRALQGVGGSGLYTMSMVILPEICPKGFRAHIGSVIGIVIACSGVMGPVLGGILTHYASWRWVFWINGPIGLVSLSIFLAAWPRGGHVSLMRRRSWSDFDIFGSFLVIASSVSVVFAFQNAGEAKEGVVWGDAIFLAPLVAGLLGWMTLLFWELRAKRRFGDSFSPALPLSLFRNKIYAAGAASTLFLGYPYLLIMYSIPLRAQVVSGRTALVAGIMLLPMLGMSAVGSAISSKTNAERNRFQRTLLFGACFMTIGTGLLTTVSGTWDDTKSLGFLTLCGFGFGLSTAAATNLVTIEAPVRDQATAHGILAQLRVLGGSLGISTSTVFVHAEAKNHLAGILTEEERALVGSDGDKLSEVQWDAVRHAYSRAFSKGMIAAAAVSAVAIVFLFWGTRRDKKTVGDGSVEAAGTNQRAS
ncbi:hypothetical protein XA68_13025 [Ophiocordyceps unilateralis]|uniref:Major facilitator superfamily (MFS) profile domain-containing protein n=1 Tax=Ophiocordyceps unilateralis TaxID=268505 RepID=A0A2A9PDP7_OPHUN|nr:hypothetical protein XA68_13025 [Ophiocordyceps unilateralis]